MRERTLTHHVQRYVTARVARGEILEATAQSYRSHLASLDRSFGARPLSKLTPKAIDRWLAGLAHLAPASRREYVSSARTFCRWMVDRGLIRRDPTAHLAAVKQPRRAPVTIRQNEVTRLLAAAPDARARAILWLMVGCGARCVEVARLQVDEYDPIDRTVKLTGKGGHERHLPVPPETAAALDRYLDVAGRCAGPLFRQHGTLQPLAAKTVSAYVGRWMRSAGVKVRPLDGRTAHGLRRTAASDVMEQSGDLRAVQEMLGHASIETTARHYLRPVSMAQLRAAMEGRDYRTPGTAEVA